MIPWFVVTIIAAVVRPFGREVYVLSRCGGRGVRRIWFRRRRSDHPWVRHLRPLSDADHYQR